MSDRTVIVPTPGSSRQPDMAPAQPQYRQQGQPQYAPQPAAGDNFQIQSGLNPVVNAANTLLTLMVKLRTTTEHRLVPQLHQMMTAEIQRFDRELQSQGMRPEQIIAARYLLCTVLDETVMNTPWGSRSGWSQRSLLSTFHRETFGGEKCFAILQRLQEAARMNLHVLELFYLCLSLGFEGKFKLVPNGTAQLDTIRDNLYRVIQAQRDQGDNELSPHWQSSVRRGKGLMHYIPLWVFAAVALAVLVAAYAGFSVWLFQGNEPVIESMQQLITEAVAILSRGQV
ncbi:type IVB secretion system protein IcmH/DotU [Sansalvadorimonas sp. 2012CJ34-2]|uniref:Type IVB secretion system protein IcmH/DotU n=1 Tax=Parendozoicomonas callyspongiae TaxID=2942213 RepID=A0ABT0PD86_9GAMM|nr:type IVB secretion system protein IcmH/DotU [Sansalvadorimonas sp. 2012CJ34-2]MCL6269343.1 type IVB secretion system protein IcmH/DotU [Sansalvadorimonas sp. 2012CJ34-2]